MAIQLEIKNVYNTTLPASYSALYTVPAGKKFIMKNAVIKNRDQSSTANLVIRVIKANGNIADLAVIELRRKYTLVMDDEETLDAGDSIWGSADLEVTCKINGVEQQA